MKKNWSSIAKDGSKLLLALVLVIITTMVASVIAAPPGTPYNLGETLQPSCAPGDTNCTVVTPAASGANSDITSLSGLTTSLSVPQGGTGLSTIAAGKLLYASALDTLAELSLDSLLSTPGGVLTLDPTIMVQGENVSLLNNDAGYIRADGTVDLAADWTIANNSITLTNGTLTANLVTDGTASLSGGTVSDGAGSWMYGGTVNGTMIQDGAGVTIFGGTVTGATLTDGVFSVNSGTIVGASGSNLMWTNDAGYITAESDPVYLANGATYVNPYGDYIFEINSSGSNIGFRTKNNAFEFTSGAGGGTPVLSSYDGGAGGYNGALAVGTVPGAVNPNSPLCYETNSIAGASKMLVQCSSSYIASGSSATLSGLNLSSGNLTSAANVTSTNYYGNNLILTPQASPPCTAGVNCADGQIYLDTDGVSGAVLCIYRAGVAAWYNSAGASPGGCA